MHFGSALWIAALLCIPGHTTGSLLICMMVTGGILSAYGAITTYRMYRGRREYRPMLEDWLWNALLPSLCYLALLLAGALLPRHTAPALYTIGGVTLALLFIGIHNAWDLAVWITAARPGVRSQKEGGRTVSADTESSNRPNTPSA
jgi:hypothetical protein